MNNILGILAFIVLMLFTAIWVWVGVKLLRFDPSPEDPLLTFTDAQVSVAGFLASTVGAGTASVLGIEIQKASGNNLGIQVGKAARSSFLLGLGIVLYAAVGLFVLLVWFWNSEQSPDMVAHTRWACSGGSLAHSPRSSGRRQPEVSSAFGELQIG